MMVMTMIMVMMMMMMMTTIKMSLEQEKLQCTWYSGEGWKFAIEHAHTQTC